MCHSIALSARSPCILHSPLWLLLKVKMVQSVSLSPLFVFLFVYQAKETRSWHLFFFSFFFSRA